MKRIEGATIVASWLMGSAALTLARLIARSNDIFAHIDGWRAAAGPLVIALLSIVAATRLLRSRRTFRLPAALLSVQLFAVSIGALAYRLDAGPFIRLGLSGIGLSTDVGNDARLLAIVGADNQIPPGIAVNLIALSALVVLVATQRAAADAPVE